MQSIAENEPTGAVLQRNAPEYSIDIVGVSKSFRRRTVKGGYSSLKSLLLNPWGAKQRGSFTHVLKDLTLRIPCGASVGLIGRNGSGKSTFLKLVTGIYRPDTGSISVRGRIAALIELGAGFHPDFTGRENLLLGGVMHGLSRSEIEQRLDQIVEFAELEDVIDDPVKTYSSGMFMRLGFSLAVHTDPDILLVDEVLAVGDAAFTVKCQEQIARLRRQGKTLILVTHDLGAVERWCDEALWLNDGEVQERGEPRRVIDAYRQYIERGEDEQLRLEDERHQAAVEVTNAPTDVEESKPQRWGSREIEIVGVSIGGSDGGEHHVFHPDDPLTVRIAYCVHQPTPEPVFGIALHRSDGLMVHGSNTHIEKIAVGPLKSSGTVEYRISRLGLLSGSYSLDVAVHREDGYPYDYQKGLVTFAVRSALPQVGVIVPAHEWRIA